MKGRPKYRKSTQLHPVIRTLFDEALARKLPISHLAERCGLTRITIANWKHKQREPSLHAIEAALNALQLTLTTKPLHERQRRGASRSELRRALSAGVSG